MSGRRPPTSPESGAPPNPRDAGPHHPPPPRSRRSARPCAARADHRGSLEKETRSDLATEHRERRGGAGAQPRRRPGRTRRPRGARLQDREAQRSCLAVSSLVSTPRCCSPPLLRPLGRRRRVALSSQGTLRTRSGRALRRTRSTRPCGHGWPPRSPAPSPRRPRRLLLPSPVFFSRSLSISGHSTRSGFCLQEQSITCPILPHFRI